LLLGLNLVVLAAGAAMTHLAAGREPDLPEFNAGKIRFWSQPAAYRPDKVKASATAVAAPAAQAAAAAEPAVDAAGSGRVCVDIADLSQAHYEDLAALLKSSGLAGGQCLYSFDKKLAWWVFWPPVYESAQRTKVLEAIHAAGVKDVLPITQGPLAQAFSLGVFSSETQASQYRNTLRSRGLEKAQFGPRPSMVSGRLGCEVAEADRMARFRAALPAWAKPVEPALCPAPAGAEPPADVARLQPRP
jgi:hypothetical protein